jgi:hypothetical protein
MGTEADLGFSYKMGRDGEVAILRQARVVTHLRGRAAQAFLASVAGATEEVRQQVMARVTGNYKRGNERSAAAHVRNRRRGA